MIQYSSFNGSSLLISAKSSGAGLTIHKCNFGFWVMGNFGQRGITRRRGAEHRVVFVEIWSRNPSPKFASQHFDADPTSQAARRAHQHERDFREIFRALGMLPIAKPMFQNDKPTPRVLAEHGIFRCFTGAHVLQPILAHGAPTAILRAFLLLCLPFGAILIWDTGEPRIQMR